MAENETTDSYKTHHRVIHGSEQGEDTRYRKDPEKNSEAGKD